MDAVEIDRPSAAAVFAQSQVSRIGVSRRQRPIAKHVLAPRAWLVPSRGSSSSASASTPLFVFGRFLLVYADLLPAVSDFIGRSVVARSAISSTLRSACSSRRSRPFDRRPAPSGHGISPVGVPRHKKCSRPLFDRLRRSDLARFLGRIDYLRVGCASTFPLTGDEHTLDEHRRASAAIPPPVEL